MAKTRNGGDRRARYRHQQGRAASSPGVDGQGLRVVGIGHQPAYGMRSGNIVDMEAATRAISSAVSTAEEMCGEHVREVIVGVSGGSPASHNHEPRGRDRPSRDRRARRAPGASSTSHLPAETADRDIIHSIADRLHDRRHAGHPRRARHVRRAAGRRRASGHGGQRRDAQPAGLRAPRPSRDRRARGRRALCRGPELAWSPTSATSASP